MSKTIKIKDLINLAKSIFKDTEKEAKQLTINRVKIYQREKVENDKDYERRNVIK